MKKKKIIIFAVILIILVIGTGSIFALKVNSLEYIVNKQNIAEKNKDANIVWNDMHPDDKVRWQEQEYKTLFLDKNKNYSEVKKKEIVILDQWTHPTTGKIYNEVAKVLNTYTVDTETSYDAVTYFSKLHGKWYFFSTSLSDRDRKNIKSEATQGPDYKELIKSPDKYLGKVVAYSGKIIEIQEEKNGDGFIRLDLNDDSFSDEIIFVTYSQSTDVFEDDIVTVYGIQNGSYTYISQANYNITLPLLNAGVIEKGNTIAKNTISLVSEKADTPTPKPIIVSPPTPKTPVLAQPTTLGFISPTSAQFGVKTEIVKSVYITVSKPEDFIEDNRFMQPSKGDKYVSIYVSFDNKSQNPVSYNPAGFTAIDSLGGSYDIATANNPPRLNYGTVNPNALASGNVVFSVPSNIPTAQFTVHYNHHSPQEAIVDFK
jgi:hypothetical protein